MRPRKQCQAQVDVGRVERINRVHQFQAEAVVGIELACHLDQAKGEILVNTPVAVVVGIRQCASGNAAPYAQMVEFGGMYPQAGLYVAQAFPIGQLGEGHVQELVEMENVNVG